MKQVIKLLLILFEVGSRLLTLKKQQEFDDNVEKIKEDPRQYALDKFGTKRMRDVAEQKRAVHSAETDSRPK